MSQTVIAGDLYVAGNISAETLTPPAASITDSAVVGNAGIEASKLEHQYEHLYAQTSTTNAANDQKVMHVVKGVSGTLLEYAVGAVTAFGSASTCVFDLLKNGSSILTATITLDNTTASYVLKLPAGYTSTALVVGDVLELKISGTTGANPAKGLFARLSLREFAQ